MSDQFNFAETIPVSDLRGDLRGFIESAGQKGVRIAVTRHGKPVAAIVPFSDLETLDRLGEQAFERMEAEADKETAHNEETVSLANLLGESDPEPAQAIAAALPMGKAANLDEHVWDSIAAFVLRDVTQQFAIIPDTALCSRADILTTLTNAVTKSLSTRPDTLKYVTVTTQPPGVAKGSGFNLKNAGARPAKND